MVTKSEIRDEIYNLIRDRIVDTVSSITLLNTTVVSIKNYYNEFNDGFIKIKSDLPIIIIEPPKFSDEQMTFNKGKYEGSLSIYIYTTQKEAAIKFMDKIDDSLNKYRKTLKSNGINYFNILTEDSGKVNSKIRSYFQMIKYNFEVISERW